MSEHIGFLSVTGFVVPNATLKSKFKMKYNDLFKKLTMTHYQKIGPPKQVRMYKHIMCGDVSCVQLPRTLIQTFIKNKILDRVELLYPTVRNIDPVLQIDLYDNQKLIIDHLIKNVFNPIRISQGTATAILNLRAGMGKTFVAAGLINSLRQRTLYIAPTKFLADQAARDLKSCFYPEDGSVPSITIGKYGKVKKNDLSTVNSNQNVTIIVINSALLRPKEFFANYGMVILDEVHSYCSDKRREIFKLASAQIVLGMSATTEDRGDGFDIVAHKELAFDGIIRAEDIPNFNYENVEFNCEVTAIQYNGPAEYTQPLSHESTGMLFTPYMNAQFLKDPYRMKLAIRELRKLYDWRGPNGEKYYTYIFCEERKPLKIVYEELKKSFGDVIDAPELNDVGEFIGGINTDRVNELRTNARILLTTYGYSGTGVSIDKMNSIIFLTPRKSNMKQILARILRRSGDRTITRKIIDIIDNKTPIRRQYIQRKIAYDFYGMKVNESKVKYDEI